MVKSPHIIWISPTSQPFFRAKGEVRCRPGTVVPKLAEQGFRINVLIPNDPTLLPKTKPPPGRTSRHVVQLDKPYPIEIIKLSRGSLSPGIYMVKLPPLAPALEAAVFSKAALALAQQLRRPVDLFHLIGWESALVPLYLEIEKEGNRLLKGARSFLSISSFREQGNFPPSLVNEIAVPPILFHPDGIEFYGRVSYLKAGLLFADGVGIVDERANGHRGNAHRNGTGMEGVLEAFNFKIRRWASQRSFRSHVEAYEELFSVPAPGPILPALLKRLHPSVEEANRFIESWGPPPSDHYDRNMLGFLLQSPLKTFAYWEWVGSRQHDYGLVLEDLSIGGRSLLSRGLSALGEYWIDVAPDRDYVVELVGWNEGGRVVSLLRSRVLRTPRSAPCANRDVVFVDVRDRRRFAGVVDETWVEWIKRFRIGEGSSAWEWETLERKLTPIEIPSSIDWVGSSSGGSMMRPEKKNP